jgi:hypothetical protein
MTALFHNNLRFYTLRVTESEDEAEKLARRFEIAFNKLSKYDQVDLSFTVEMDGFEAGFKKLENY